MKQRTDSTRHRLARAGVVLTAAIRVYLGLGYLPCLYASDQRRRWEHICAAIKHRFDRADCDDCTDDRRFPSDTWYGVVSLGSRRPCSIGSAHR